MFARPDLENSSIISKIIKLQSKKNEKLFFLICCTSKYCNNKKNLTFFFYIREMPELQLYYLSYLMHFLLYRRAQAHLESAS